MQDTTLNATTLERLISASVAAPSFHNTQPWRFRLDPATATVEVRARGDHWVRQLDPTGRALHISVGAALFNLRVAIAHFGWEPVVRLLPRPQRPDVLACVRLAGGPGHGDGRHGEELYDAIWHRHSSRMPFEDRPLPAGLLAELADAAQAEGAILRVPDTAETGRLMQLTAEAERRNTCDPERRAESRAWVRDGVPEGIPPTLLGPQDATGHLPMRDFSALRPSNHRPAETFERTPTIAVLSTAHDRRADWLRAGEALERVLLVATVHSVRASLLHQALEWPDLRWALRDPRSGPGHVQMLIRLGYGPPGRPTPRHTATEALDQPAAAGGPARDRQTAGAAPTAPPPPLTEPRHTPGDAGDAGEAREI